MTGITSSRCFGQIPNGSKDCRSLQPTKEGLKVTAGARARRPGSRPRVCTWRWHFYFHALAAKPRRLQSLASQWGGAVMRLSREDESWNQLLEAGQAGRAPDRIRAGSWEAPLPGFPQWPVCRLCLGGATSHSWV